MSFKLKIVAPEMPLGIRITPMRVLAVAVLIAASIGFVALFSDKELLRKIGTSPGALSDQPVGRTPVR